MRLILVYINPLPSCDDFSVSYRQALSLWKRLKTKFISAKKFKIIANVRERCQNLNTNSNIFFISWKISASQPASQPVSFTPTSQKQTNEARRWTLYERRVEKKLSRGRQGMAGERGRERERWGCLTEDYMLEFPFVSPFNCWRASRQHTCAQPCHSRVVHFLTRSPLSHTLTLSRWNFCSYSNLVY